MSTTSFSLLNAASKEEVDQIFFLEDVLSTAMKIGDMDMVYLARNNLSEYRSTLEGKYFP